MAQADQLPKQWVELFVDTNQQTYTSTPTAPGQFNPPGWDRSYDYGTPEQTQRLESELQQAKTLQKYEAPIRIFGKPLLKKAMSLIDNFKV